MTIAIDGARRVAAFIRLGRPHFLVGGFVMHALGVSAALWVGAPLNLTTLLLGQLAITATQWMVHYANDYFDLHSDADNRTPIFWSGGSRVLPARELHPNVAYITALVLALIALVAGLVLTFALRAGWPALMLVALSLFISWGYSAPPFQWHSRGIGEATTAFVVTVLTPVMGFFLQAGYVAPWLLLVIWPVFCLQLCFQLSVNFPDAVSDARTGKQTLVVRRPDFAMRLYRLALLGAYAAAPLMLLAGLPGLVALAVLIPAPLAVWLFLLTRRGALLEPKSWVWISTGSIALSVLTGAGASAAFLLSRG